MNVSVCSQVPSLKPLILPKTTQPKYESIPICPSECFYNLQSFITTSEYLLHYHWDKSHWSGFARQNISIPFSHSVMQLNSWAQVKCQGSPYIRGAKRLRTKLAVANKCYLVTGKCWSAKAWLYPNHANI